tara:strand:+ start:7807 stop:8655 length:849 start_codon:yes stop_codon:yes gene_type:complete
MSQENPEKPIDVNPDNTYLVTIGRMNPPHGGHLKIIERMLEYAEINNINPENINVILSNTQDTKKNPLLCEEQKKQILRLLINYKFRNLPINIVCMAQRPNHPILTRVNEILNKKNIEEIKKMVLFIGKDRANSYKFVERYISPNLFETIVLDRDDSSISATKMREYALENTDESFDEFLKGTFDISEEEFKEFEEFKKDPKNEEIIEIMKEVFNQVSKILLEQKQKRLKGKRKAQHSGGKNHIKSKRKSKKRKTKQRKTKQRKSKKSSRKLKHKNKKHKIR